MTDIRYYVLLAGEAGVFKDIELEIMKETLEEWERRSDSPSTLIELTASGRVSGFAYFGPANGTEFTFDLKWLVVDKLAHKQGIGDQLLQRIEVEILKQKRSAILTVETTTRKEGAIRPGFFQEAGFSLIGHIPDFYGKGDDFLMYAKHLRPPEEIAAEAERAAQEARAAEAKRAAQETQGGDGAQASKDSEEEEA
jgi:ribosomal protein S18 acetylase RimI-like enzyme